MTEMFKVRKYMSCRSFPNSSRNNGEFHLYENDIVLLLERKQTGKSNFNPIDEITLFRVRDCKKCHYRIFRNSDLRDILQIV